jgi:hypothetical protein
MNFNKSLKYLIINTFAFFVIIGLGLLGDKLFHWGHSSHAGGLPNFFTSVLIGLVVPLICSFIIVRKRIVEVQYVFVFHVFVTIVYIFIWVGIFL